MTFAPRILLGLTALAAVAAVAATGATIWIGPTTVSGLTVSDDDDENDASPILAEPQVAGAKWVGELATPRGRGPFPVVMILHGCDGVSSHSRGWAKLVARWGYATFLVDSYTRREQQNICQDVSVVPVRARAQDIAEGAAYLRTVSSIDPKRIGALGLSHGASAALEAARSNGRANGHRNSDPLQAMISYYPWCPREAQPLATDVLILIGAADDWTPSQRCVDLVARYETIDGRRPMLKVYPDATHAFEIRAPDRVDFGHPEKFHPEAAADAIKLTRQFLDQRLRK
jgi:dienelactone hydrolase